MIDLYEKWNMKNCFRLTIRNVNELKVGENNIAFSGFRLTVQNNYLVLD